MSKKLITKIVIALLVLIVSQILTSSIYTVSAATPPSQLKIYIGPTNIPADNEVYECIAVQLQDSRGNPARATEDTTISLTSSFTNIGNLVNPTLTIHQGFTYATAKFQSTFSPGKTTITATASNYATVQAAITTTGPIPATIVVYGYPPILPADSKSYERTVVIQLQDSSGSPAKAPNEGVEINLSSSNTAIGTVDSTITIPGGSTYVSTTFTTTNTPGTTSITAAASGYTSKQATFTTKQPATTATALKVYLGPPKVPADDQTYTQVAIMLQSSSGVIARAPQDIQVTLASSAENIGTIDQTITIPQGETYALANFDTTYKPGSTTITALATNCKTSQEVLTTIGTVPSKLGIYSIPSTLPADTKSYNTIQVQLQDSSGRPAKDPNGNITVYLFSSTPEGVDITPKQLTIPFGQTYTTATITSTYAANSTTITAQASNYITGQTKITTCLIDQFALDIVVLATPSIIKPGMQANITALVTYEGKQPASGVTVTFSANKGASNFSKVTYQGNGYYTATFTAPTTLSTIIFTESTKITYLINANATKTGYTSCVANTTLTASTDHQDGAGTLQLHINQDGNPISDAFITSITQPTGAQPLNGITNKTGDAVFMNVMAGPYTIQITKPGYEPLEQIVILNAGQIATRDIALSQPSSALTIVIGILAATTIAALTAVFMIRRRKNRRKVFQKKTTIEFIQ